MLTSIGVIGIYDSKTLYAGTVSVHSENGPYTGPCPHGALHSVFSIIQSDPLLTPQSIYDLMVSVVRRGDLFLVRK